jgi:hypothetical protein
VSPRAVSEVWGCRPPSLVVLSSISRRLFQEPCTLGGHLAGSFPPILHPSPPTFNPFFHLYFPRKARQNKNKNRRNVILPLGLLRPRTPRLSPLPHQWCWPPYRPRPVSQPCPVSPALSPLLLPSYPACTLPLLSSLPCSSSVVLQVQYCHSPAQSGR